MKINVNDDNLKIEVSNIESKEDSREHRRRYNKQQLFMRR